MSLVNPEVIGYLNEYIMRVHMNNEDPKKVISEMLQQGKFRKYEVTIITKVPYQRRVRLIASDGTSFITFFDLYTGQINEGKAVTNNQSTKLGDVDIGRLVMNNVAYKYISLVPINIVGKATVVGVEMHMKAKKGFVEPHMVILDVEQSNVEDTPLDKVFQVLPIEVDADPRKNLRVVLDLFAPQIIGQEHAKKALLLTAVGSGPYVAMT